MSIMMMMFANANVSNLIYLNSRKQTTATQIKKRKLILRLFNNYLIIRLRFQI